MDTRPQMERQFTEARTQARISMEAAIVALADYERRLGTDFQDRFMKDEALRSALAAVERDALAARTILEMIGPHAGETPRPDA